MGTFQQTNLDLFLLLQNKCQSTLVDSQSVEIIKRGRIAAIQCQYATSRYKVAHLFLCYFFQ